MKFANGELVADGVPQPDHGAPGFELGEGLLDRVEIRTPAIPCVASAAAV
jgi:hypothetical protein